MKTHIRVLYTQKFENNSHNEFGLLLNYGGDYDIQNKSKPQWNEPFAFLYKGGVYIIFSTLSELFDFMIYGDNKVLRAYLEESEFDLFYSPKGFEGTFRDHLNFIFSPN